MTRVESAVSPVASRPESSRATSEDSPLTRAQIAWLTAVLVTLALVYLPTVLWLFDRWTMSVWHNAHGMLIPGVVGYFAYHELKQVRNLPTASSAWGFAFLVPALALHVLDAGIHTQLLSAASIVLIRPARLSRPRSMRNAELPVTSTCVVELSTKNLSCGAQPVRFCTSSKKR